MNSAIPDSKLDRVLDALREGPLGELEVGELAGSSGSTPTRRRFGRRAIQALRERGLTIVAGVGRGSDGYRLERLELVDDGVRIAETGVRLRRPRLSGVDEVGDTVEVDSLDGAAVEYELKQPNRVDARPEPQPAPVSEPAADTAA